MRATDRPSRRRRARPRPRSASLRRRTAASLINAAAGLGGLATTGGTSALILERLDKLGYELGGLTRIAAEPQRIAERLGSRSFKLAVRVLTLVTPLRRVKRRSPGYAMLGLRLVDARSGRAPSRRQRLVRNAAMRLWPALCRRALPMPNISPHDRDQPRERCLPTLAMIPLQAAIELPIFSTPLRQSLIDKLAGTVVVRDQP